MPYLQGGYHAHGVNFPNNIVSSQCPNSLYDTTLNYISPLPSRSGSAQNAEPNLSTWCWALPQLGVRSPGCTEHSSSWGASTHIEQFAPILNGSTL
jgi:hypothetical protein